MIPNNPLFPKLLKLLPTGRDHARIYTRFAHLVELDGKRALFATNGRALAIVPTEETADAPGPIPPAALERAKATGEGIELDETRARCAGLDISRGSDDARFPLPLDVILAEPRAHGATVRVVLDPRQLRTLLDAIGATDRCELEFRAMPCPDGYDPEQGGGAWGQDRCRHAIRVTGDAASDAFGLLMPIAY